MPVLSPRPDDALTPAKAAALLGITVPTIRLYTKDGRLPDRRGPNKRRMFLRSDIDRLRAARGFKRGSVVLYARVSSRRQASEGDLDRQIERLSAAVVGRRVAGIFSDVASGLNDHRSGLADALRMCAKPEVSELVVTHPDRLARFGTRHIELLLAQMGTALTVIETDPQIQSSPESELVRDMLSVITSFSDRLYGVRSTKARALRHRVVESLT